jgi:arylsulfatase A-like enzyme
VSPGRRLVALLLLPSAAVLAWWLLSGRREAHVGPEWVAYENVFEALLDGELVRTTEVLDAGTLRGQAQTIEVDPRAHSSAEGLLSVPQGDPPYAWCVGLHNGFQLDVLEPQDRRLHIELANGTSAPQHVRVDFNGATVIEQDLPVAAAASTMTADIPAAQQVTGANRVDLTFAQTETRQLVGQPVPLPLAGVLTHVHFLRTDRVERLPSKPPPLGLQTETGPGGPRAVLLLPPGTSARAPLRLPDAGRVALRFQLEHLGVPFELWLTSDAGLRTKLVRVESVGFSPRELQVDLGQWSGQPVVLDFWAQDGSAESAQISSAVVLVPEGWKPPATPAATPAAAPPARLSFLLVTLDAFARHQLGIVGPPSEVVPRLTDLAAHGTNFRDASATASYTLASVGTLLTGQSPLRHGVVLATQPSGEPGRLPDDAPRLARELGSRGWRTAAWVTNPNAAARHGYDAGFERYDELFRDESLWDEGVAGSNLPPRLGAWLAEIGDAPFFAWVHVFEPHAPYVSPPDLASRWVKPYDGPVRGDRPWIDAYRFGEVEVDDAGWRHLRELYAARQALADRTLGELLDALAAAGRAEDTVVIVTGDHGEALGEHGTLEHGDTVYGEQIDVPLVVHVPGREPTSLSGPVTLADIAPTVLGLAGVPRPADMDGADLLAGPVDEQRPLFARSSERWPKLSWTRGPLRLIVDLGTRRKELYDIVRDPGEETDILLQRPASAAVLYRELTAAVCAAEAELAASAEASAAAETGDGQAGSPPGTAATDPATDEQIRAIGYAGATEAGATEADEPEQTSRSSQQGELLRALLRRS